MTPAVSIVIPTFNRAALVLRAIDSVLNQSYKNFEVLVIDDGSTDTTESFIKKINDPRLTYFKTRNHGVAHARNFGVKQSQTDWVCFLDSDDVWRRHKLSEQIRFHNQNHDVLISQTDDVWVRHGKRVNKMKKHGAREGAIFRESLKLCLVCASSVMVKKKLFLEAKGFDESLPTCEDYDLWLRILTHHNIGFIPKKLVTKFGGHEDQLSKKYPIMDQYRIISLEKILQSGLLNAEQSEWASEALALKRKIVEQGRKKRQK